MPALTAQDEAVEVVDVAEAGEGAQVDVDVGQHTGAGTNPASGPAAAVSGSWVQASTADFTVANGTGASDPWIWPPPTRLGDSVSVSDCGCTRVGSTWSTWSAQNRTATSIASSSVVNEASSRADHESCVARSPRLTAPDPGH